MTSASKVRTANSTHNMPSVTFYLHAQPAVHEGSLVC